MQGLLNDWRRTNYTKNITPKLSGEDVIIMGWVHEIRDLGGIIFVLIRDKDGLIQIIYCYIAFLSYSNFF